MDPAFQAILFLAIGAVVGALVVGAVWWSKGRGARSQRRELRRHFGPEYDHTVETLGSRDAAERSLVERTVRARGLRLRNLSPAESSELSRRWELVQQRFVDAPGSASSEAHDLLQELLQTLGYPTGSYEEEVELISVHHPDAVGHYRAAHQLAHEQRRGRISTEDLRQSMIHYRALFQELLSSSERSMRPPVREEPRPHLH